MRTPHAPLSPRSCRITPALVHYLRTWLGGGARSLSADPDFAMKAREASSETEAAWLATQASWVG
jgi:hypothetical protein